MRTCAACGRATFGCYTIDRDGPGKGPRVVLCETCGAGGAGDCALLWANIAKRRAERVCRFCGASLRDGHLPACLAVRAPDHAEEPWIDDLEAGGAVQGDQTHALRAAGGGA